MRIAGLQKLTLLDFPDKTACIIFTPGCNLACPFCHNADLVCGNRPAQLISEDEVFDFFSKRKNVLEGVCITGGEPLLQPDLGGFIKKVRSLGYAVKLDTNGSFPDRLKQLMDENLLDYVAMDIKNSKEKYALTAGAEINYADILKSADLIMGSGIDYEFRTTIIKEYHTLSDIENIGKQFRAAGRFYLQKFVDSGNIIKSGLSPFSDTQMQAALNILQKYIPAARLR